jgi:hypothetical protein
MPCPHIGRQLLKSELEWEVLHSDQIQELVFNHGPCNKTCHD